MMTQPCLFVVEDEPNCLDRAIYTALPSALRVATGYIVRDDEAVLQHRVVRATDLVRVLGPLLPFATGVAAAALRRADLGLVFDPATSLETAVAVHTAHGGGLLWDGAAFRPLSGNVKK